MTQLRLFLAWLPLLVVLTGCGNDPNPPPLMQKRADGSPWITRYNAIPQDIKSLDPQHSYDMISSAIVEPVYDCLLTYNPFKTDPYEVMPQMLEAMPQKVANPDGTVTYTCRLQRDIHFHNDDCWPDGKGREVTAADVHYAFQRICDPKVESPFESIFADCVIGVDEAYKAAEKAGKFDYERMRIPGIELVDRYTFRIKLKQPYPQIVYWLAMPATTPVAREAVEYYDGLEHEDTVTDFETGAKKTLRRVRPGFRFHMVGTGPFYVHDMVPAQRFRLVRTPGYHTERFPTSGWTPEFEAACRPLAGRSLPLVDEVQITIFNELLPPWILGRQGYLDRVAVQKAAASAAVTSTSELAPEYAARGMKLDPMLTVSTFYMSFNMEDPLVGKNKKLRQALSCAYDPQKFVDMLYGGVAPVAQQLLPPGVYGFQKDFKNPYGKNLEKGRRLLAEAGYPEGRDPATGRPLEITMDVSASGGEERQLYEYEQSEFEQLGVKMHIVENTFAAVLQKLDKGNYQIASGTGWGADYPDAENFFNLFVKRSVPPAGKNECRYTNPEFEALYAKMSSMEDTPERLELIKRMNDILIEDCPIILNFNKAFYTITQPWAPITHKNLLYPAEIMGGLRYQPVYPALREQKRREWNPVPKWPIGVAVVLVIAAIGYAVMLNQRRVA